MGNCHTKNNQLTRRRHSPINRNFQNKPIVNWNVHDVYNWLSFVCDGELYAMAQIFKKHKIDGQMLLNLTHQQLNAMNISIDHQNRFKLLLKVQKGFVSNGYEPKEEDDDNKEEENDGAKGVQKEVIIRRNNNNQLIKPHIMHKRDEPVIAAMDYNQNKIEQTTICYEKLDENVLFEMEQIASDVAHSMYPQTINPNNGISTLNGGNNGNTNSHRSSNRNKSNNNNSSQRSSNTGNNQNNGGNGSNFGGIGGGGGNGDDDGDDDDKNRKKITNCNDSNEAEEDEEDDMDQDDEDNDDEKERENSVSLSSLNHNAPSFLPPIDESDAKQYNLDIVNNMKYDENKNDKIGMLWSEISKAVQEKQMVLIQNKMNEIQMILKGMNMNNTKKTNNKKKKEKRGKKNKSDLGRYSYEGIESKRGIGNWQIIKKLTKDRMPKIVKENISDYFGYIDGCITMQQYDDKKYEEIDHCIINLDVHHKQYKEEKLYLVSKIIRNTNKERNYKWKDCDILIGKEVKDKYNIHELPKSSRDEYKLQSMNGNKIKELISESVEFEKQIITKTKWHKLDIFNIKNNKCRMMINITNPEFELKLKEFMNNNRDYTLIPIIMFNNMRNKYYIHYVHIISIMGHSVGISYEYDKKRNRIQATGIHLDKDKLFKMHELASPHHMDQCQCFNTFKSKITHLAVGNPDAQKNLIKSLNKTIQDQKLEIAELKKKKNNNNNSKTPLSVTTASDNNQCAVSRSISFTSTPSITNDEYSYSNNNKNNNINLPNLSKLSLFSPNYAQNAQNSLSVPNLFDYNNNNNNNNNYYGGNWYQQNIQNQSFNKYQHKQY